MKHRFDISIAVVVTLLFPLALCYIGMASIVRYTYPLSAMIVGAYFVYKKSPWYIGFCIWLFCAVSLIRRLVDEQSGWDASNPVLLAPYLACSVCAVAILNTAPRSKSLLTYLGLVAYGLILSILYDRPISGLAEAIKWAVGPLIAIYIISRPADYDHILKSANSAFLVAGPLMAIYGIVQFIDPPIWDTHWLINQINFANLSAFGRPFPYEIRVFSTMNSPGSLGAMLGVAILIALSQKRLMILNFMGSIMMAIGLALTNYRAIWAATLLGTIYIALFGSTRSRVLCFGSIGVIILLITSSTIIPEINLVLINRLESIQSLSSDASGQERLHQYDLLLSGANLDNLVVGQGFGISGATSRLDGHISEVIDSGVLLIFNTLGIFGGALMLVTLLTCAYSPFSNTRSPDRRLFQAITMSTFIQLPFGLIFISEMGIGAWIYIGLCAANEDEP